MPSRALKLPSSAQAPLLLQGDAREELAVVTSGTLLMYGGRSIWPSVRYLW